MNKITKNKASQIWILDLIVGVTIFILIMVVYFIFVNNISSSKDSKIADIQNEILIISETLMSAGSPENWTSAQLNDAGITNGNYLLNESKLSNLSNINYQSQKQLLKTKYDYLVFFENRTSDLMTINGIQYIGKWQVNNVLDRDNIKELEKPKTVVSLRRLLVYKSDIISMVIYSWG
jgi:hypothetical protein